jgi:hypothetical protein
MTIKARIRQWVKENYGQSELDNPSWDINSLAKHLESTQYDTKQITAEEPYPLHSKVVS